MIIFRDGPARAATLLLRRAPFFLRVVVDEKGEVDALDLIDDTMNKGETSHCYVCIDGPTTIHLKMSKPGKSGFYVRASYALYPVQPDQATMSDNATWKLWCLANRNA